MIDLPVYCKTKDKCCLAYFGDCEEYLLQLAYFRSNMEAQLPGLTIYIAARDASFHHLRPYTNVLSMNDLRSRKPEFGYLREILCDTESHPIEKLLLESGIFWLDQSYEREPQNNRCLIVPQSGYPTCPLTDAQVQKLVSVATSRGLRPEFGDDPTGVGHVWGVESWQVWKHASCMIKAGTLLVPTGVGTRFYRSTFSAMEVLEL
jgi:hypothetical protein